MNSTKKTFSFMLIVFLFLSLSISSYANNDNVKLWLDGIFLKTDTAPIIEKGVTLVPIRVISESLGIETEWLKDSKQIVLKKEPYDVVFAINKNYYSTGDERVNLPIAPKIINSRTMVPIRPIAEIFGKKVDWDATNKVVVIGEGYVPAVPGNTNANISVFNNIDNGTVKDEPISYETENTSSINSGGIQPTGWTNGSDPAYWYSNGLIIGNLNSYIYHLPSGRYYEKTLVKNAVFFETEQEAINAGFRRAKR